ncbi:uncharacterized protein LOC120660449 isoform X2 [Panicum virgatum]|uniref:uncharacterized protein LOC120660449 isoform X2 n=1 Tax=Panicum virgatum TaxID=38727 RepID=UPI0019D663E0|nr:uncharacterized protein LOC120660449 isoform X2 [Panicum virgatum]
MATGRFPTAPLCLFFPRTAALSFSPFPSLSRGRLPVARSSRSGLGFSRRRPLQPPPPRHTHVRRLPRRARTPRPRTGARSGSARGAGRRGPEAFSSPAAGSEAPPADPREARSADTWRKELHLAAAAAVASGSSGEEREHTAYPFLVVIRSTGRRPDGVEQATSATGADLGTQGRKAAAGIGQSAAAARVARRRHSSAAGRLGGTGRRRRKGGEHATVRRCRAATRRLQVRPPVQRRQQLRSPPMKGDLLWRRHCGIAYENSLIIENLLLPNISWHGQHQTKGENQAIQSAIRLAVRILYCHGPYF